MKRDDLREALQTLEREQLITSAQREPLEARLWELLFPARDASNRIAQILAWLGGVLVAAGLIYFVAWNWDELAKWTKLALIFGALAALHVGGYVLAEVPGRSPAVGRALTSTAMLALGGAIALVAQIYHLSSHWPHAWLFWWLLDLPFLLLIPSRRHLAIVTGLFVAWVFLCTEVWSNDHELGERFWTHEIPHAFVALTLGALLPALGALCRRGRFDGFALPLRAFGLLATLASTFLLSFHEFTPEARHDAPAVELFGSERLQRFAVWWTPAEIVAGAAIAILVVALAKRPRNAAREPSLAVDSLAALVVAVLLAASMLLLPRLSWIPANALLGLAIVLLIVRGVKSGDVLAVNLALLTFFVTVAARYVEWLPQGTNAAAIFVMSGVLLLVVGAFVERLRRRFVADALARRTEGNAA